MSDKIKNVLRWVLSLGIGAIVGIFGGLTITNTVKINEQGETTITTEVQSTSTIELSPEAVPTKIETADGEVTVESYPTVEAVDSNLSCPEGEECGLGKYIYAPTKTVAEFQKYTLNKCWNTDGYWGGQCWDLGDMFWQNYTKNGRNLSTCGTGAAKGIWNCKEQNAGTEFSPITDKKKLQAGDWVIFKNGTYGHVGMALGSYNNGYIALLGQNQGGKACDGGGGATNIINISLSSFAGAFRPKTYEKKTTTTTKVYYKVKKGDNLTKIAKKYKTTVKKLVSWNKIKNPNIIYVNQKLRVK